MAESIEARARSGTLDDGLVVRIFLVRRAPDVNREVRNEFERGMKGRDGFAAEQDAPGAFQGEGDAAVRAITFSEDEAAIPHQAFLPIADGSAIDPDDLRGTLGDGPAAKEVVRPFVVPEDGRSIPDAGNRLLVIPEEDRESGLLTALRGVSGDVLASDLLEPEDLALLDRGDTSAVLSARADRLTSLQETFLDRMCEWEQDDSPDLEMLVVAADDADVSV